MYSSLCTKLWIGLDSLKDRLKNDIRGISALEYVILIVVVIGALVLIFNDNLFGTDGIFGKASTVLEKVNDIDVPTSPEG